MKFHQIKLDLQEMFKAIVNNWYFPKHLIENLGSWGMSQKRKEHMIPTSSPTYWWR